MLYSITITAASEAELRDAIRGLAALASPADAPAAPQNAPPKAAKSKPAASPAPEADSAEEEPAAPQKAAESIDDGITIEQVRAALVAVAKRDGKEASKGVLREFGAEKLSDIPAEKYGAMIEACGLEKAPF